MDETVARLSNMLENELRATGGTQWTCRVGPDVDGRGRREIDILYAGDLHARYGVSDRQGDGRLWYSRLKVRALAAEQDKDPRSSCSHKPYRSAIRAAKIVLHHVTPASPMQRATHRRQDAKDEARARVIEEYTDSLDEYSNRLDYHTDIGRCMVIMLREIEADETVRPEWRAMLRLAQVAGTYHPQDKLDPVRRASLVALTKKYADTLSSATDAKIDLGENLSS